MSKIWKPLRWIRSPKSETRDPSSEAIVWNPGLLTLGSPLTTQQSKSRRQGCGRQYIVTISGRCRTSSLADEGCISLDLIAESRVVLFAFNYLLTEAAYDQAPLAKSHTTSMEVSINSARRPEPVCMNNERDDCREWGSSSIGWFEFIWIDESMGESATTPLANIVCNQVARFLDDIGDGIFLSFDDLERRLCFVVCFFWYDERIMSRIASWCWGSCQRWASIEIFEHGSLKLYCVSAILEDPVPDVVLLGLVDSPVIPKVIRAEVSIQVSVDLNSFPSFRTSSKWQLSKCLTSYHENTMSAILTTLS